MSLNCYKYSASYLLGIHDKEKKQRAKIRCNFLLPVIQNKPTYLLFGIYQSEISGKIFKYIFCIPAFVYSHSCHKSINNINNVYQIKYDINYICPLLASSVRPVITFWFFNPLYY